VKRLSPLFWIEDLNKETHKRTARGSAERGVSIVEMLIVVAMIGVVTAFAVMQITGAQQAMRLSNSAREFMSWLDKTRLDSVRRHAAGTSTSGMANVKIASATSYTVTIDQDGDGTLDPPRTFTLAGIHGAAFAGITIPATIYYNWRGRPVDSLGNLLSLSFRLQDANGHTNPINLTSTGDASLGSNVNTSNVSITQISTTANVKKQANVGQ
jgi:prepilin-type N-terminal cleavage/methylation domain-containing protein